MNQMITSITGHTKDSHLINDVIIPRRTIVLQDGFVFYSTFNITILSLVFSLIKSEENFSWKWYLKLINPLDGF